MEHTQGTKDCNMAKAVLIDSEVLTLKQYLKIVETELDTKDFKILSVSENRLGRVGFLGDHYVVQATVQRTECANDDQRMVTLSFFAKFLPANEKFRHLVEELKAFEKEHFFYQVLSKDFSPVLSHIKLYPKCYIAQPNMVVLEDLGKDGFVSVSDVQGAIDSEHLQLALSALASFHSASIIKEQTSKKSLEQLYPEIMFENIFVTEGDWSKWLDAGILALRGLLPYLPAYKNQPALLEKINEKFEELKNLVVQLVKPMDKMCNVICHGDPWIANFLFKYRNNKPEQASLIDFQSLRYGPPALDIQLLLQLHLEFDENRSQKLSAMEDFYYECLRKELEKNNFDIKKILPNAEFKETCEILALFGSITLVMYYQLMGVDKDFISKVFSNEKTYEEYVLINRTKEIIGFFETDLRYRKRMNSAMENLIQYLLKNKIK